jgi:predicted negative regulator of RcsB-dependent stress response
MKNLGDALLSKGRTNEAIERYHQVLRIDSNHADAKRSLEAAMSVKQRE